MANFEVFASQGIRGHTRTRNDSMYLGMPTTVNLESRSSGPPSSRGWCGIPRESDAEEFYPCVLFEPPQIPYGSFTVSAWVSQLVMTGPIRQIAVAVDPTYPLGVTSFAEVETQGCVPAACGFTLTFPVVEMRSR